MTHGFVSKPLTGARVDQAFPLIQAVAPEVTLEGWQAYAARLLEPAGNRGKPRGLIVLEGPDGYLYGLFAYAVAPDLRHGRALVVDEAVALGLIDPGRRRQELLRAMEELARRLGCGVIRASLPSPVALDVGRLFAREGFLMRAIGVWKVLPPAAEPRTSRRGAPLTS